MAFRTLKVFSNERKPHRHFHLVLHMLDMSLVPVNTRLCLLGGRFAHIKSSLLFIRFESGQEKKRLLLMVVVVWAGGGSGGGGGSQNLRVLFSLT